MHAIRFLPAVAFTILLILVSNFSLAGIIHDESIDGDIPKIDPLYLADLTSDSFVFEVTPGSNKILGSSAYSGTQNYFFLHLDQTEYLSSVDISWTSTIFRNDHVFWIQTADPTLVNGRGWYMDTTMLETFSTPLDSPGLYQFSFDVSDLNISNGYFGFLSSTSVGGIREPQLFSIDFNVVDVSSPGTFTLFVLALSALLFRLPITPITFRAVVAGGVIRRALFRPATHNSPLLKT